MTTPWMDHAWAHIGVRETPGAVATDKIVTMYAKAGHGEVTSDEVPWCAAFVGACLKDAALPTTGSLLARSYLTYGTKCELKPGAIAVFKRGQPPSGHVAFVTGWGEGKVRVLGGNQGDKVCEASFPLDQLLDVRWPPEVPASAPLLPPAPIARSGTVWGTIAGAVAAAGAFMEQWLAGLVEWTAKLAELSPVQSQLASLGGNIKALSLGMGISAAVYVISRRVKASQEGKRG